MGETPEQLFARAAAALRTPPVQEWETFPFTGDVRVRPLAPPLEREPPRKGAKGVDCGSCAEPDSSYVWADTNWRLRPTPVPTGLPLVLILETRAHVAEPGDLPADRAGEFGILVTRIDAAMRGMGGIGRVHVCRWGDGAEHLHWWFMARPARLPQLIGNFASVWDEILPPTPPAIWESNVAAFLAAFTT